MPADSVSQIEFSRLVDRVDDMERDLKGLLSIQGDIKEIKARLDQYATTDAMYREFTPIRKSLGEMQGSVASLSRDISLLAQDVSEATKKVNIIFDMHEQLMRDKARRDQEEAEKARQIAEEKLRQAQEERKAAEEKHGAEMKAIEDKKAAEIAAIRQAQEDRKFTNRLKKNWLPVVGALITVILGLSAIVAGIIQGFKYLADHWR